MKAIVCTRYGPPDVLELHEVEKPAPADDEILIQVRAAAVNPLDSHLMRGRPALSRVVTGLRQPRNPLWGVDLAGRVEAVGKDVTTFQPGDEVFGCNRGAFAEYVCTKGKALALKPANLAFEQAAAVPVAGFTALQGLRDKARLQPGQKALINGASGGVGTFAVQIAKAFGAEVTAVCSTRNVEMVRSLGADQVIDYTQQDFTRNGQRYDLLFDCVGNHSFSACRRVMNPKGICVIAGGPFTHLLGSFLLSPFVSQRLLFFIAKTNSEDLVALRELIEANQVRPVIDKRYPLSEAAEAVRYLAAGHARGKVVITVEQGGEG